MSFLRFLFNCFSYFILLTIHLFIFNAGPMLIAVFITEMVILHKYVYLLLLLLRKVRDQPMKFFKLELIVSSIATYTLVSG